MRVAFWLRVMVVAATTGVLQGAVDYAAAGPHPVETQRLEWRDAARERVLPVKVYWPAGLSNAVPVVIFSHGLGGTREGYEYLGRQWASHGLVSIHLQHPGSDDRAWRGQAQPYETMKKAVNDPRLAADRPQDVRFALDTLERLNREDAAWRGRLDMTRVGMAGHSFGAWTTLAVAGMGLGPRARIVVADHRVRAAIAMSAPANEAMAVEAFDSVQVPVFLLTGTQDDSLLTGTRAAERRIPFDRMRRTEAYFLNLAGGDHMIFAGRSRAGLERETAEKFLELIRAGTTAFWLATLKEDAAARRWLADGGFEKRVGDAGVFEKKLKPAR